jgi:hypothetical protein
MSYYYEDDSYCCYSEPTHYYDPSPEPVYDDFYQDTSPDPAYYVDIPQYDELEAYAEIASQKTYTEDEIHPTYRDHPDNHLHYDEPPTVELYYEDEVHPAYRDHSICPTHHNLSTNDIHEDSRSPEHHWEEYTWHRASHKFDGRISKYDPPIDPTFYIPSSHNNAPNWDLVQSVELIESVLKDYREWFAGEADNVDIEEWTPRINQLTLVSRHMEEILTRRRTDREVTDGARNVCEDNGNNLQPQSTPPPYDNFDVETITSPPDIRIPDPLPPSPNIRYKPTSTFLVTVSKRREPRYHFGSPPRRRHPPKQNTHNHWNKTRTRPPDIRLPLPLPLSPNIHTQSHPQSLNLRPSTHQQSRQPPPIRPQRKHPPKQFPTIPTAQIHHLNAIRRILRRATRFGCSRTNIAWRRVDVC